MELIRNQWKNEDILEFKKYEKTLIGDENNCKWEQRIVNTKLQCFARTSAKAKEIAKQLKKGNFIEFVENIKIENHLESLLCAYLICLIKNFDKFENELSKYVQTIDNWASCDTLKFEKRDLKKLSLLSEKFLKSEKLFVRRCGLNICFELIKHNEYIDFTFEILNKLKDETEYYVNMCGAWLLSDCFARNKEKTIKYFKNNKTNDFIINKGISKCRDSLRNSKEEKDFLLQFKR